ncbi:MAG: hypothetical protein R3B93_14290 [Bacteroidia bacterium]
MRKTWYILPFMLLLFSCKENDKSIKTQTLIAPDLSSIQIDFCEPLSIELEGLYSITDTLFPHTHETLKSKQLLIDQGFEQISFSWGNWDKGPRMVIIKFMKENCTCELFKKYFYHQKDSLDFSNLRITERIICNTDIFMDD